MTRKRWFLVFICMVALAGGAWALRVHRKPAAGEARSGAPADAGRPVPVAAAVVERRDVPIYLEGLGSVVAFKTVTVTPQVDGRLVNIAFTEGQEVKKGDLLVEIDPRPYQIQQRQAEAALAKDRAVLHDNKLNLDRYTTLRKQNLVQQQMVDDQQALVAQGEAQTQADQAQLDNARLNLEYARLTSPIDGITGVRLVDLGNVVRAAAGTALVVITQVDPIAVIFTLPEDVLPQVLQQMRLGPLTAEAQSRDGTVELGKGQVALVDNQINQATGTIRLKAVFANPKRMLWPNQFVKIRLLLMTRKDALVVPASVVQRGPNGTFAYVVKDGTAELRTITVDATEGNLALVGSGLLPGDQVVSDGQYQLRPGARVAVRQPGPQGPQNGPNQGQHQHDEQDQEQGQHQQGQQGQPPHQQHPQAPGGRP